MANNDVPPTSKGLAAARWLIGAKERYHSSRRLNRKAPTLKEAATLFKCGKTQIGVHMKALQTTGIAGFSERGTGRPRCLLPSEETAIDAYAVWLIKTGSFASKDLLEDAANRLRARRVPPLPPVSKHWWPQWKKDHPEFESTYYRPVEANRLSAEEQIENVTKFFDKYEAAVKEYNITGSACWNMDECGCRLAMISGKFQILCIKKMKKKKVCQFSPSIIATLLIIIDTAGCTRSSQSRVYDLDRICKRTW
jgi:hypothetical protein